MELFSFKVGPGDRNSKWGMCTLRDNHVLWNDKKYFLDTNLLGISRSMIFLSVSIIWPLNLHILTTLIRNLPTNYYEEKVSTKSSTNRQKYLHPPIYEILICLKNVDRLVNKTKTVFYGKDLNRFSPGTYFQSRGNCEHAHNSC
jgi:hypothetical protein